MAPPNKPVVGELYSPREQSEMHGGTPFRCAPPKDGRVLLLRVKPRLNPDAPRIIDWEESNDPWVKTIEEQGGTLPVYVFRRPNAWEYMGRFRVARVTTDAATLAERRKRTGLQVSYAIHLDTSPSIGVLVVTMFEDDYSVFAAMRAGAKGYVLKDADEEDMLHAIRAVGKGEAIFSPAVARRVIDFFTGTRSEVVRAVPARAFPEIAARLYLSPKTVRNHISNIFAKLQVADRAQAIIRAREAGLG